MAVLDEDFGADLTLVEGDGGVRSSPAAEPVRPPRDWQMLYEQAPARAERERVRADAAEARAEELRWAEVAARSDAGSWKSRFRSCRRRLSEANEEAKELRRAAKAAPSLRAEAVRLETLLSEAGNGSSETGAIEALGKEVARLREALAKPEAVEDPAGWRSGEAGCDPASREEAQRLRATIRALRKETTRLNKEVARRNKQIVQQDKRLEEEEQRSESLRETGKKLSRESLGLYRELRILRDCEARVRSLSDEAYRLRHALEVSEAGKDKLKARLAKLRTTGATLSKLPFDEADHLRNVLRRSRRQKTTIGRLHKENARLRKAVKAAKTGRAASEARLARLRTARKTLSASLSGMDAELRRVLRRSRRRKATIRSLSRENARLRKGAKTSRNRIETLEADLARLRATGAVLSRALYGRKSEQQEKARSGRPRGQQHGAPGHGRTRRPGLKERSEEHNPPPDACVCGRCGQPYAPNGAEESTLVEIEVKAHKRVIRRPRWRRTCECASSPMEVSAPAVPRLFPRTLYGTSFWARFLFEHCACFRPVHRVAAWFSAQGLTVSPGTLADSLKRFVPLFEPVAHAILAHQNKAALRHADETGWRVQELRGEERSSRAWLWTSVSSDAVCFHIDPSRSAEAAQKLFGEALLGTVIVCGRYSAYKRLVRLLGGLVILAFCWSHVRRDFIDCAAGQVDLTDWCRGWIERIAGIYRLNEARLEHYDPGLKRQAPAFDAAQTALKEALDALFAEAQRELAALPDEAREGKEIVKVLPGASKETMTGPVHATFVGNRNDHIKDRHHGRETLPGGALPKPGDAASAVSGRLCVRAQCGARDRCVRRHAGPAGAGIRACRSELRRRSAGVRPGAAAEAVSARLSAPGTKFAPARSRDAAQSGSDLAVPECVPELQDDCRFSQEQCGCAAGGQPGGRAAVPRTVAAGR